MEGQEIAEIGSLYKAGAVAISDDGLPVVSSEVTVSYTHLDVYKRQAYCRG